MWGREGQDLIPDHTIDDYGLLAFSLRVLRERNPVEGLGTFYLTEVLCVYWSLQLWFSAFSNLVKAETYLCSCYPSL